MTLVFSSATAFSVPLFITLCWDILVTLNTFLFPFFSDFLDEIILADSNTINVDRSSVIRGPNTVQNSGRPTNFVCVCVFFFQNC